MRRTYNFGRAILEGGRVPQDATSVEAAAIEAVAGWLAHKHTCLPIRFAGKTLVLAMANPLDSMAIKDVQFASSRHVSTVVATGTDILNGIRLWYSSTDRAKVEEAAPPEPDQPVFATEPEPAEPTRPSDASTAVELCAQIMLDAVNLGASDIHVEAGASETRIRLRIDGVLREHLRIPDWMRNALLSRIKILAKLDIAEQRLPQDGRMQRVGIFEMLRLTTELKETINGNVTERKLRRFASRAGLRFLLDDARALHRS